MYIEHVHCIDFSKYRMIRLEHKTENFFSMNKLSENILLS